MNISQIERRKLEAELIGRLYTELCAAMPPDAALGVILATLEKAAFEAGQEFAKSAPGGPSFEHFKTITDIWGAGGAMEYELLEDTADVFRLNATRCGYAEAYRDMGLPAELVRSLSCNRDAPFARGYSDRLEFTRTMTLAENGPHCDFLYCWKAE